MEQKIKKNIFVFKKIGFESGTASSHNPQEDTCHGQSDLKFP